MEKDLTFQDVLALRDLETEHGDHHALKSIAWVIGVVIVIAIIAWWIRRDRDCRENEYLHNGDHRSDYGEHKGIVKLLEKQVAALEEKAYYTHGKLDKLYGEFGCYTKYNTHEVEEIEARVYPKGYIGRERYEGYGEGCGCGERRHGNCGKKFVRQDTYTPNTQQVIVTEDCNCAA